jgi:hypothetical protein
MDTAQLSTCISRSVGLHVSQACTVGTDAERAVYAHSKCTLALSCSRGISIIARRGDIQQSAIISVMCVAMCVQANIGPTLAGLPGRIHPLVAMDSCAHIAVIVMQSTACVYACVRAHVRTLSCLPVVP